MLLRDRQTFRWALGAGVLLVAGVAAYVPYRLAAPPGGPSGGSTVGLIFGSIAALMLLLALLLGARKRVRTWRVGRAYAWMQLHVWMGLLCYPVAYFHAGGLRWGGVGSLTWVVMLLLSVVWLSGIVGLVLQQFVPRLIFRRVAREVTYEQHRHVLGLMRAEALAAVASARDEPDGLRVKVDAVPAGSRIASASATSSGAAATLERPAYSAAERFATFYERNVAAFLADRPPPALPIRSPNAAGLMFRDLRRELPASAHAAVGDLEVLVEERRQMLAQATMHRALHGWLFVHVPLSYALAALVALHAVFALRFTR